MKKILFISLLCFSVLVNAKALDQVVGINNIKYTLRGQESITYQIPVMADGKSLPSVLCEISANQQNKIYTQASVQYSSNNISTEGQAFPTSGYASLYFGKTYPFRFINMRIQTPDLPYGVIRFTNSMVVKGMHLDIKCNFMN